MVETNLRMRKDGLSTGCDMFNISDVNERCGCKNYLRMHATED